MAFYIDFGLVMVLLLTSKDSILTFAYSWETIILSGERAGAVALLPSAKRGVRIPVDPGNTPA